MAVGARRSDILSLVVGEGARLAAGGFCAGILGTLGLTRFMKSILFRQHRLTRPLLPE